MKRYYSLYQDTENKTADIYIYGDITSWEWYESDVSSYTLSKRLRELEDVESINIYINSYGGEVAEGLAIYNALKRHKAKVTTYVDGFACSIASVIFAAGDERVMSNTSLLMIHNAWTWGAAGDSNGLKKQAEDLEKITQASINAYMNIVNIKEEELKEMMNEDTWINGNEALEMEFATKLVEMEEKQVVTQSVRKQLLQKITKEPAKVPVANIRFDESQMREIVQEVMEDFKQQLKEQGILEEEPKHDEEPKNKPLEMMKAFFDVKNKEED